MLTDAAAAGAVQNLAGAQAKDLVQMASYYASSTGSS
jgi:hypothetical protein